MPFFTSIKNGYKLENPITQIFCGTKGQFMLRKNKFYKRLLKAENKSHYLKQNQLSDGDCRAWKATVIILGVFVLFLIIR